VENATFPPSAVGIGIVTALPVERAAVQAVAPGLTERRFPGDVNNYLVGRLPSRDPQVPHGVAVGLQTRDGTRDAAALCTDMARSCPRLSTFVMCGIAAGASPGDGPTVRLGDIVVATSVVDYGHVRRVDGAGVLRRPLQIPAGAWLRADLEVRSQEEAGRPPWAPLPVRDERFHRPEGPGTPSVHRGAIGSADLLLRDAQFRDEAARDHGLIAFEMEGAGVAVGSHLRDLSWFMVRGIADHGDNAGKSDRWHPYAALAAAAYVRALLAECPPFIPDAWRSQPAPPAPASTSCLGKLVDALAEIPVMRDDYQRRAVLDTLPRHIRTAIPDGTVGRLHLISVVQTCEHFPAGREALLDALLLAVGPESPGFRQFHDVARECWSVS
jgi:nucleoside phosphorylase